MDADATTVAQAGAATFVEVVVDHSEFEVFLGIDVGKDKHYAVALDRSGGELLERELPQDETRLRTLIAGLGTDGPVLAVVDQPASIGALVWRWPAPKAPRSPICPGWRCVVSRTCIGARPRPMPAMPGSSPKRPAARRMRCGPCRPATSSSPS